MHYKKSLKELSKIYFYVLYSEGLVAKIVYNEPAAIMLVEAENSRYDSYEPHYNADYVQALEAKIERLEAKQ